MPQKSNGGPAGVEASRSNMGGRIETWNINHMERFKVILEEAVRITLATLCLLLVILALVEWADALGLMG